MTKTKQPAMKDGIIKRGSTYSYVVRERDPETRRTKPRWVGGFRTREDAKRARDKARNDVHRGTYVPPKDLTVGDWLDRWITGHAVELKPSTVASYRRCIDLYLKPKLGHLQVQGLSPSTLSGVFRDMGMAGGRNGKALSARSVEYTRAVLRKAMADAVVERVVEVNPVTGSKSPRKQGKPKHVTWTGTQQRTFIEAATESRWWIVWALALATGMRRGELCGLEWSHIDLDAATLSVERSATQIGTEIVTTDTKNHENRPVALDPYTVTALRAWRKQQAAERLQWGPAYTVSDLVFTWESGARVRPHYLTTQFVADQDGRGLPRMTLHGARHSHATTLLREGVPVHIVSKRLGHRDPSVTLNVYADAIPEDDTRAVDVFTRAVWGA
ncbi:tyrosine-type recombinase/integrase [Microlunatus sp. Y2014]|uniref:tyrosine-type recombinase/integrase n=1 Tax=Microlunatus sp. Y2014 TaxID=3418488 RepID=UPI003DA729A1